MTQRKTIKKEIVLREAPKERTSNPKEVLAPVFNDAQMNLLLNKTPQYAKMQRVGKAGMMLTYVKHGYVTDQLNKAFGFDWDLILDPIESGKMYALQVEQKPNFDERTKKNKPIIETRHISVCGHLVIRVHGKVSTTITKSGFGSQLWLDTMEFGDALKGAKSDLLKVCAAQVGVALDLYWSDMDEQIKFENEQEAKRKREEATDSIDAIIVNNVPHSAMQLLTRSAKEFQYSEDTLNKILGDKWMDSFSEDMWDKVREYKS